jgi:diguanylate cyclase (GGDEF)-like protein
MSDNYIEYQEERIYSFSRMSILLILTFLSFLVSSDYVPKIQLVQLVLGGLMIVALLYHAFITYKPDSLVHIRRNVLILFDFIILTFSINILGENGIYLMPIYALIVMQSSVSYGLNYYISGALFAIAGFAYLVTVSPYWQLHYNIITAFGITTVLIPLFYIKTLIRLDKELDEVEEKIAVIDEVGDNITIPIVGVEDRDTYKKEIKGLIKKKEPFTLLFISLDQIFDGEEEDSIADMVLQKVVDQINGVLNEDDIFARLGGSEFVIISRKQRVFLRKYLQKLEDAIVSTHRVNDKNIHIEPNIGITLYPEDGQNEMILGKNADEAMHAVKKKQNVQHMFYRGLTS